MTPKYQLDFEAWRKTTSPPWDELPVSVRVLAVTLIEVGHDTDMTIVLADLLAAAAVAARTAELDLVDFLERAVAAYESRVADELRMDRELDEAHGIQS